MPDVSGETHLLSDYAGKIVVLEWTNYDCPFVRKFYSIGAMQEWQERYTAQGVVWLSICSSAPGTQGHFSRDEWVRRMEEAGVKATAVLLDELGNVGRAYGARNTPQMVVINPEGKIVYEGAIDSIRSANSDDVAKARNYTVEAIEALLGNGRIEVIKTAPYGCTVKY